MTRAAYQGAPGAFSEDAARAVLAAAGARPRQRRSPCERFEDVFDAVRDGAVELGVVPVENTLAGSVQATYDLLARAAAHRSSASTSSGSCTACSRHPVSSSMRLRQVLSTRWRWLSAGGSSPGILALRSVVAHDTAGAVEDDHASPARRAEAAIASRRSADLYGAVVLAEHLEDDPANFTRFL